MQPIPLSRRRVVAILAAAPGLVLTGAEARAAAEPVTWTGPVLGALGRITLHHPDRGAAERLVASALAEVRRLEAMFSLWRADSLISALSRSGALVAPPSEFVEVLAHAREAWAATAGAFDPTVQPLRDVHAAHLATPGADPAGPPETSLQAALARVGLGELLVSPDRVAFARRGMALTLNGIGQGYITDSVVGVLRAGGVERTLVDKGEARALGTHPSGRPWRATTPRRRGTRRARWTWPTEPWPPPATRASSSTRPATSRTCWIRAAGAARACIAQCPCWRRKRRWRTRCPPASR